MRLREIETCILRTVLSEINVTEQSDCSEREYQRGDEIAWYADGDKIVRNEYNPASAYAFGIVFAKLVFFFLLIMKWFYGELIECS